jgi:mRNA interferase YafQ
MRTIERSTRFKKDFKRELRSGTGSTFIDSLSLAVERLAEDSPLPVRFRDHALTGNWDNHRDCHIRPDLVLIYRRPDDETLELVRLGSHSELDL